MIRPTLDHLAPRLEVDGYPIRPAIPEDAAAISRVLQLAFEVDWSEERVQNEFFKNAYVLKTFVAVHVNDVVATASAAHDSSNHPTMGTLHWVGVDPVHRGHRLGEWISLAVLHEFRARGLTSANLTTDDHRLAAIRTYTRLGFEPQRWHSSHEARWIDVMNRLG